MKPIPYFRPAMLEEAWDIVQRSPGARYVAGATDLFVKMKNGQVRPDALVSLRSIPRLRGIGCGESVRIGATTTISDIVGHEGLRGRLPLLVEAARRLGSVQIRNAATIGGNLANCSPCADTATALLVMEARVRLEGPNGRREMPVREYFRGPGVSCAFVGEILTDIIVEPPPEGTFVLYQKKGRVRMDLAVASVAALLRMDAGTCVRARLAAGSCAAVPLRLVKVEALLEGRALTAELAEEAGRLAAGSVAPISDIRATEAYRRRIIGAYVRRAVEAAMEGGTS